MSLSRVGQTKLHAILVKWSRAIQHASAEHSRPNSFGVVELAGEYRLTKRDGYRIGRERMNDLWAFLGGNEGWGSKPTYSKGRFYV